MLRLPVPRPRPRPPCSRSWFGGLCVSRTDKLDSSFITQRQARLLLARTMYFKPRKSRNSEMLDTLPALPSTHTKPLPFDGGRLWLGWRGAPQLAGMWRACTGLMVWIASRTEHLRGQSRDDARGDAHCRRVTRKHGHTEGLWADHLAEPAGPCLPLATSQSRSGTSPAKVHATGPDASWCEGRRL